MTETVNLVLMGGEVSRCVPRWNMSGKAVYDDCLKLYIPLAGEAEVVLAGQSHRMTQGTVCLFNGRLLESQSYGGEFYHCWMHFEPASLRIKQMLYRNLTWRNWGREELAYTDLFVQGLRDLTEKKQQIVTEGPKDTVVRAASFLAEPSFVFLMQAYLIRLLADLFAEPGMQLGADEEAALTKIQPAVDYMDKQYDENPPLDQVAETVAMAASHFHRVFVKCFGLTPHKYMLRKRLSDSRRLLLDTALSVKEIGWHCGYENEFYFSKVFKKEYGVSPSKFRNTEFNS